MNRNIGYHSLMIPTFIIKYGNPEYYLYCFEVRDGVEAIADRQICAQNVG